MRTRVLLIAVLALLVPLVALTSPPSPVAQAAPGDPVIATAGRRTISGDFSTTCVILADTSVQCWGSGGTGQIGDGGGQDRPRPAAVVGLTGVVDISAGDDTTCAVTDDARLWCWGSDASGELGNGELVSDIALVPQLVPGMEGTLDVTAGYDHVCAAKVDGTAWCWGEGDGGELATGDPEDRESPFQIAGITDAVATAVVETGSCVLHRDKTVSCWGANYDGEVGDGTTDEVTYPVKVPGVDRAIDIVKTDSRATCVLNDDGSVQCWGEGGADWLHDATSPVTIGTSAGALDDAIALRATDGVICVVRGDFSLWCAGDEDDVLPYDHPDDRETLDPTGIVDVADVALGYDHGCVVLTSGAVECWGDNRQDGTVGVGAASESDPLVVPKLEGVTAIDAGDDTTCAIASGGVWCWGDNADGLVADSDEPAVGTPRRVGDATDLVDVTVGDGHACVLDSDAKIACWGNNNDGELGVGDTSPRSVPTPIAAGGSRFTQVSAGDDHTCALRFNKAVACWGSNSNGQLGIGSIGGSDVLVPTTTTTGTGINYVDVSAGYSHSCAAQANGRIRCWGTGGYGQLGDGHAASSGTPVLVKDTVDDFETVVAGDEATCALRAAKISCWGQEYVVRGLSSSDRQETPDDRSVAGTWTSLDVESAHACAIEVSDDGVFCWGYYTRKRLTSAVWSTQEEPIRLSLVPKSVAVTTGDAHSCALAVDTTVWCWGFNSSGQIGRLSSFVEPQRLDLAGPAQVEVVPEPPPTSPPPTTPPTLPPTLPPANDVDVFTSVDPARLVETRSGSGNVTIDGRQQGIGRLGAGQELRVVVAGRADIPADATAAVVNVTAIGPAGTGFVTAHPCLPERPLASSLNYSAGTNLGNEIIVQLDGDGDTCLYTSSETHLAVDVAAYLPAGAGYSPVPPARIADTRTDGSADTVDGLFEADGLLGADSEYRVSVAGRAGVADDADAAVVNVTAIRSAGVGYFTIHPCADPRPTAASLNYIAGVNRGNEIIAPLSADGDLCVYTSTGTHLAIDVVGEVTSTRYRPIVPARYLDTREGPSAIDGTVEDDGLRSAGQTTVVPIAGIGAVPTDAKTVTVNLTAVRPTAVGYATVHACLADPPNAASLNYVPGVNGGNEIVAELSDDGQLCIFTSQATHLTVDIAGYTL